jgi:uncharacterized protein
MILKEMSRKECTDTLAASRLAWLACVHDNRPYIVPIHYALSGTHLYCFSMPGQRINWMRANPFVCLQTGEFHGQSEWRSVVIEGRYEELPDSPHWESERNRAWSLLQKHVNWWEPGGFKPHQDEAAQEASPHIFFRIAIENMTGRRASEH